MNTGLNLRLLTTTRDREVESVTTDIYEQIKISLAYPKQGIHFKDTPKIFLVKRGKFEMVNVLAFIPNPFIVFCNQFSNLPDAKQFVERVLMPYHLGVEIDTPVEEFIAYNTWGDWNLPKIEWLRRFFKIFVFGKMKKCK